MKERVETSRPFIIVVSLPSLIYKKSVHRGTSLPIKIIANLLASLLLCYAPLSLLSTAWRVSASGIEPIHPKRSPREERWRESLLFKEPPEKEQGTSSFFSEEHPREGKTNALRSSEETPKQEKGISFNSFVPDLEDGCAIYHTGSIAVPTTLLARSGKISSSKDKQPPVTQDQELLVLVPTSEELGARISVNERLDNSSKTQDKIDVPVGWQRIDVKADELEADLSFGKPPQEDKATNANVVIEEGAINREIIDSTSHSLRTENPKQPINSNPLNAITNANTQEHKGISADHPKTNPPTIYRNVSNDTVLGKLPPRGDIRSSGSASVDRTAPRTSRSAFPPIDETTNFFYYGGVGGNSFIFSDARKIGTWQILTDAQSSFVQGRLYTSPRLTLRSGSVEYSLGRQGLQIPVFQYTFNGLTMRRIYSDGRWLKSFVGVESSPTMINIQGHLFEGFSNSRSLLLGVALGKGRNELNVLARRSALMGGAWRALIQSEKATLQSGISLGISRQGFSSGLILNFSWHPRKAIFISSETVLPFNARQSFYNSSPNRTTFNFRLTPRRWEFGASATHSTVNTKYLLFVNDREKDHSIVSSQSRSVYYNFYVRRQIKSFSLAYNHTSSDSFSSVYEELFSLLDPLATYRDLPPKRIVAPIVRFSTTKTITEALSLSGNLLGNRVELTTLKARNTTQDAKTDLHIITASTERRLLQNWGSLAFGVNFVKLVLTQKNNSLFPDSDFAFRSVSNAVSDYLSTHSTYKNSNHTINLNGRFDVGHYQLTANLGNSTSSVGGARQWTRFSLGANYDFLAKSFRYMISWNLWRRQPRFGWSNGESGSMEEGYVVRGTVEPSVEGARVLLDSSSVAIVDRFGHYAFENVSRGPHLLTLDAATVPADLYPLDSWQKQIIVDGRNPLPLVTFTLARLISFRGRLVNAEGQPIIDAVVCLTTSPRCTKTGEFGYFTVDLDAVNKQTRLDFLLPASTDSSGAALPPQRASLVVDPNRPTVFVIQRKPKEYIF